MDVDDLKSGDEIWDTALKMAEEYKRWIDTAPYVELLRRWRFSTVGDPIYQGPVGDYYARRMAERRQEVGLAEHTRASKAIGWE